jgi:hypothetical protein
LYEEIQRQFVDGNVDKIMELSRRRITFGAILYNMSRDEYEKQVHQDLAETLAEKPRWKTVQDPDQELTVHEFLPGRVMRVLDLRGNPPLRVQAGADGMQVGYDVILAMTHEGLVWIM